jgi:hypothetical protein
MRAFAQRAHAPVYQPAPAPDRAKTPCAREAVLHHPSVAGIGGRWARSQVTPGRLGPARRMVRGRAASRMESRPPRTRSAIPWPALESARGPHATEPGARGRWPDLRQPRQDPMRQRPDPNRPCDPRLCSTPGGAAVANVPAPIAPTLARRSCSMMPAPPGGRRADPAAPAALPSKGACLQWHGGSARGRRSRDCETVTPVGGAPDHGRTKEKDLAFPAGHAPQPRGAAPRSTCGVPELWRAETATSCVQPLRLLRWTRSGRGGQGPEGRRPRLTPVGARVRFG